MSKVFQVRYTVGDKTVAHEHYTEKGAKADAKLLSKSHGNAMLGEIDVTDDGVKALVRVWEFTGGEMGKPIKRDGPPTDVEVLKDVEATKLPEGTVEKKPKAPKMSDAEKLAKKREDAAALIKAIDEGTYVPPVRGRKPGATGAPKKAKVETDKVKKLVEILGCTEDAAKILASIGVNSDSQRTKVALALINSEGPILASQIVEQINAKSEEKIEIKGVMVAVNHVRFLFSRENQPWTITIRDKEDGDKRLNLVPVKIEIQEEADDEPEDKVA